MSASVTVDDGTRRRRGRRSALAVVQHDVGITFAVTPPEFMAPTPPRTRRRAWVLLISFFRMETVMDTVSGQSKARARPCAG
jgi:hypothetical protein